MRIDRIDLFHVAMPLKSPWRTAYGEDHAIHSLLCRIDSGSLSGWGEAAPFAAPCYSPEWTGGAFAVAREWLAPALLGRDIDSAAQLQQLLAIYKGNPFAKAALDTAWWCLHSRHQDKPLHRLLHAGHHDAGHHDAGQDSAGRDRVPVGADFGVCDSLDELLTQVGQAVDDGFQRIKLKFRPGWDTAMVQAVREQHPRHPVHIDCNSGYSLADTQLFKDLDRFELAMFEQPLGHDDLVDHAELQQQLETPICLDESITHADRARQALQLGSCRFVNIKPGRVGGLTPAVRIHDLCRDAGIPCWVGGMLESGTGAAICTALAMLDNFTYPADIFPSSRFYELDLAQSPLELCRLDDGSPGIEALNAIPDPHPQRLAELTIQQATLTA